MSDKHRISEKRPEAEKREKTEKTVSPAPAEKPLPGLQSPEEFVSNIMRSVEATGQLISKLVEGKDKRSGAFTVASGMAELREIVRSHCPVLDERSKSLCRGPGKAQC